MNGITLPLLSCFDHSMPNQSESTCLVTQVPPCFFDRDQNRIRQLKSGSGLVACARKACWTDR